VSSCGITEIGAGFPCFTFSFNLGLLDFFSSDVLSSSLRHEGEGEAVRESGRTVRTIASL
jgi:hypothetical protein